jgi:serine/threonine protein kinase
LQLLRGGGLVRIESLAGEGGQGVLYRALMPGGMPVAVKWYRQSQHTDRLRRSIEHLSAHGRPHPAFAWPLDLVEAEGLPNFGYVMSWIDQPPFRFLAEVLSTPEQPSFRVIAEIAREIASAFAALHAGGLCYRDISFGNLLVDPDRAAIAIVDNDNVGTDESPVFVRGTARFMAPEVISHGTLPSTVTDLHSLAVFLFYLLVHGHPLMGSRIDASYSWQPEGCMSESDLLAHHLGSDPLFVFHPRDPRNRPLPGDPMLRWWSIYPPFIRDLFIRSFTIGLVDASLWGRVTEGVWRLAFARLRDCVSRCSCGAELFQDPDDPPTRCWNCGNIPPQWPYLNVRGQSLVLCDGAALTSHHLAADSDHRATVGAVHAHPRQAGDVVLRNLSDDTWTIKAPGEIVKQVRPGQLLGARPMDVDFGSAKGSIRLPERHGATGARQLPASGSTGS